jgi:hypothetical protein
MAFLYPQVLYGLFALAIPIVIHLFNFRRFQKQWFNNVALLRNISKKTKKQSQLKHIIVLILRLLTITALVFAFARPFIPNENNPTSNKGRSYISIYIDNSFSMTSQGENGSLLNQAQNAALSVLDSYDNSSRFHLITNQMDAKFFRWFNKKEMIQNIMEVEAVYLQSDIQDVLQREKMLRDQDEITENTTLYLLSDFQKSTSFQNISSIDSSLNVRLLPFQSNPINNLSIDTVYFRDPVQLPNSISQLSFVISNNGSEDQNAIPVKLFVDEEQKAIFSADIRAGESKMFPVSFSNNTSGSKLARIEIDDYPIVYDDRLYFEFQVRSAFNVAMIYKKKANPYLQKLYGEDTLVNLVLYRENQVNYGALKQYDLIIADELSIMSSGLQNELSNYVKNGGFLLIIPGELIEINSWLRSLGCPSYLELQNISNNFGNIDKKNDFFNRVFEEQWEIASKNQKIDLPFINRYFTLSSNAVTTNILTTRNNQSILTKTPVEKGGIYQLVFPLRKEFTNFPEHALFVPVFFQLILQSANNSQIYEQVGVDKPIVVSNLNTMFDRSGDHVIELELNNRRWIPRMTINRVSDAVLSQIEWPEDGFAKVIYKQEKIDDIAVNYNRTESNFNSWTSDELADFISEKQWPQFKILDTAPKKIKTQLVELNDTKQLWRWFLLSAIFFIFVETLLLRLWN